MIKYCVFDNGKPAMFPDCDVAPSWDNNVFDTFGGAVKYARNWLGYYDPGPGILKVNEPYEYSGCGCHIEIRKVSIGHEPDMRRT